VEALDECERLRRDDIGLSGYANRASSVELWRASVEESGEMACITWSKYPA
jgi:hypothetical protein